MTRDQLTPTQRAPGSTVFLDGRTWGLGQPVIVEGERKGAFGWDGGLGTTWLVDPARDLTVFVLTRRQFESPRPLRVHRDLQDAAYAALV